jgi:hypothetical protein
VRGARHRSPAARVPGDAVGRLAEVAQQIVELALDVAGGVDPVEEHLRALDDAVAQVGQELHPLRDQVVRLAAGLLDDAVGLTLRLAANQLGLALGVAQQACSLSLRGAHDRMDALRGVTGETSIVETVHAPTVSPVRSRQNRLFV